MNGIYILANDFVYHQLVALINSIEVNVGKAMPICIIPYDDRLEKVRAEIERRPQVTLFENQDSIARWEAFATRAWKAHDRARNAWKEHGLFKTYRLAMHRKLCCLDGDFDKFIYFDADTLALGTVEPVFEKLDYFDWVTNDYQYCSDVKYIFDAPEAEILKVFDAETLKSCIFCAGWFASKKTIFSEEGLENLLVSLEQGDANLMALRGPDQSLLNYMVLRSGITYHNFALHGAPGSHWSSKFDQVNHVLYDKGRQLMYLHYMSIASKKFNQLCEGVDAEIPYRDLFLHYRYLKSASERPSTFVKPHQSASTRQLIQRKLVDLKHKFQTLKRMSRSKDSVI